MKDKSLFAVSQSRPAQKGEKLLTKPSQLDVIKAGLRTLKKKTLLPPASNTNGLKTGGVNLATNIIFCLFSESVSRYQRRDWLLERRGECIRGNEERSMWHNGGLQAIGICDMQLSS